MKWVLLILIPILLIAVAAILWWLLQPSAAAWCCMQAGTACSGVSGYQECAAIGGNIYHADQATCDTLCSLLPAE